MNKKVLVFLMLGLFLLSFASAVKYYDEDQRKYRTYDLLVFKKYDISLTDYQDSVIDSYAEGNLVVHKDAKVFKKLFYKRKSGVSFDFDMNKNEEYKIYLNNSYQQYKYVPNSTCNTVDVDHGNGTAYSYENCTTHNYYWTEDKIIQFWEEVNYSAKIPEGSYRWRIEAKKPTNDHVDWIIQTDDEGSLDAWAWWNNSWDYKKEITGLSGEYATFNVTYDADMQIDFDDLRFLDSTETTELNYTIRSKVNSVYAYVTVDTNNASSVYMYFGNTVVSTTESINDTYLNPYALYYFEGNSEDQVNNYNGINSGVTSAVGLINYSYDYTAGTDEINISSTNEAFEFAPSSPFSFLMDLNPQVTVDTTDRYVLSRIDGGSPFYGWGLGVRTRTADKRFTADFIGSTGSYSKSWNYDINAQNGNWIRLGFTFDGTSDANLYMNSSSVSVNSSSGAYSGSVSPTVTAYVGNRDGFNQGFLGLIDEVKVYDRELSSTEINELSSGGSQSPSFGTKQSINTLTINNVEPLNNTFDPDGSLFFNCTCTDDTGCLTLNMSIDGTIVNTTTGGGATNLSVTYTNSSIPDGVYNWYCSGNDAIESLNSSTFTFEVDTTEPTITIYQPNASFDMLEPLDTLNLNYSISDDNLDDCYYSYNNTNSTLNCSTNTTFTYQRRYDNLTVYANDTLSNLATSNYPFIVKSIPFDESYGASVIEGSEELFYLSVDVLNSTYQITSAYLVYNGTFYEATSNINGQEYNLSYTLNIPAVGSTSNATFFWQYNLADGTQINFTEHNQSVSNINIDDCSSYGITLFNLFLKEERDQVDLTGNMEIDIDIYTTDRSNNVIQYSTNFSSTTTGSVCLENDLGDSEFSMDTVITYNADNFADEVYNFYDFTLTNDSLPQNVTLYDLNSSYATEFLITYKDESFLAVQNALINIQRKYVSEGTFKTIELPITDQYGQTKAQFDTDKGIYTIDVTVGGQVVASFEEITVLCQDALLGDCDLNLNSLASSTDFSDWENYGGVSFTTNFDPDTRTVTKRFVSSDGSSKNVNLLAYKQDAYENTLACNDTLTSASGTLTCTVSDSLGNISIVARTYVASELVETDSFKLDVDPTDIYGQDAYVLALILMVTIPFMFLSTGVGVVIGGMIGLLLVGFLNLVTAGSVFGVASSIMWLLIAGGVVIWKISQRE